jgi:hypothetical protein
MARNLRSYSLIFAASNSDFTSCGQSLSQRRDVQLLRLVSQWKAGAGIRCARILALCQHTLTQGLAMSSLNMPLSSFTCTR